MNGYRGRLNAGSNFHVIAFHCQGSVTVKGEKVDFKELEYVLFIAQEKNISKAARKLYITQPALSRALHHIEDELGTELFVRSNRQYIPTYTGELYLEMARSVLAAQQGFQDKLKHYKSAKNGTLSLGITPGRGRFLLPRVLPAFKKIFPEYNLKLWEEDVDTLERYLREGTIEVAIYTVISPSDYKPREFQYKTLAREELVLCTSNDERYRLLSKNLPTRKDPWIDLHLLKDENFLLLKENLTLGNFTGSLLKEYGLDQHIIRLSSINTLLALAAQDIGLAFASRRRVEEHDDADKLSMYSFGTEPMSWSVVAACRKDYQIEGPVEQLIRIASEVSQKYRT